MKNNATLLCFLALVAVACVGPVATPTTPTVPAPTQVPTAYVFAKLPAKATNGTQVYCSDCQVATLDGAPATATGGPDYVVSNATCVGSGAGAIAWMINGTWKCSYTP
jgi:hypothetical protein